MTEPTIICPNCRTEIKLTESLAAPLLEATRCGRGRTEALQERKRTTYPWVLRDEMPALITL